MRLLLLASLLLLPIGANTSTAADKSKCEVKVTRDLLDANHSSTTPELAKAIVCVALPISVKSSDGGQATAADKQAAGNVVILASKIIGNGAAMASASAASAKALAEVVTPAKPNAALPGEGTRTKLTPEEETAIAGTISCQSKTLIGSPDKKCTGSNLWEKDEVIELAAKIIGNGKK